MSVSRLINKYPGIRRLVGQLYSQIPPKIRMGKDFWTWLAFFKESELWSLEQLQNYQIETLRDLLRDISKRSSYYQSCLKETDIDGIESADDFKKMVPPISRDQYVENFDRIHSRVAGEKVTKYATSGTTGKALQFYTTNADDMREWAAICHQWGRVGYDPIRSRRAEFRGLTGDNSPVEHFPDKNMSRFSILELSPQSVLHYAKIISENRLEFYHGYPSALFFLSSIIMDNKIDFPQPKAVLLASEEVHDYQLEIIQKCFPSSKLFAHYGCAERTVLAGWCEYNRHYHVLPQYSMVEVDDTNGEIIGTNLFNRINPFIRYRTTDSVMEMSTEPCPDCGRAYVPRFIKLGGRREDALHSIEKGRIAPALMTFPLKGLKFVNEVQFVQYDKRSVLMKYSLRQNVREEDLGGELNDIRIQYRRILGDGTSLEFERVDTFKRSASGKFKWIISAVDK